MTYSALPSVPGADDFRALARSSPWRFRTLHFTYRVPAEAGVSEVDAVQAWLDRDARCLTVRTRHTVHQERGAPYSSSGMPVSRSSYEDELVRRSDGLVAGRPGGWEHEHGDPIWGDYRWTAMLDPVELSDGVQVEDVGSGLLRGRLTWSATCAPSIGAGDDWVGGYDPGCGCCPLLDSAASRSLEYGTDDSAGHFGDVPSTYLVRLDVQTGIAVDITALDGGASTVFVNEIHAVDQPLRPPAV